MKITQQPRFREQWLHDITLDAVADVTLNCSPLHLWSYVDTSDSCGGGGVGVCYAKQLGRTLQ